MARRPGRSFRKLVKRGTNVRDSLLGKLLSHSKAHGYGKSGDHELRRNQVYGSWSSLSDSSLGSSTSLRNSLVLEKEDDEIFGFEIMNNNSLVEDLRVHVSRVQPESPAEKAGIKQGDVLVSVNDVCVSEIPHQQITDMIVKSGLIVRLETISALTAQQMELKKKLRQLKSLLNEKTTELRLLVSREEELTGVKLADSVLGESKMSLSSSVDDDGSSAQSSSIGSRWSICGSVDASSFSSMLEEPSPLPRSDPSSESPSLHQEDHQSASLQDSAQSSTNDILATSPPKEGLPQAERSGSKLSVKQSSVRRSSSFSSSKQGGFRNRITSIFSTSRGSLMEAGLRDDV